MLAQGNRHDYEDMGCSHRLRDVIWILEVPSQFAAFMWATGLLQ